MSKFIPVVIFSFGFDRWVATTHGKWFPVPFFCLFLIFNWRIIALQYCVSICQHQHESALDMHMAPSSWTFLLPPIPFHPPRLSQRLDFSFLRSHRANYLAFTHDNVYLSMLLFQFVPSSLSPSVSTSLFAMSASPCCSANTFISTNFLDSIYMC